MKTTEVFFFFRSKRAGPDYLFLSALRALTLHRSLMNTTMPCLIPSFSMEHTDFNFVGENLK